MPSLVPITDPNVISEANATAAAQFGTGRIGGQQQQGVGGLPGVDESLVGDAYLQQFPRELQEAAKNYVAGKVKPSGNPRRIDIVKMIAGKYASDMGTSIDDTIFTGRNNTQRELHSTQPNSLGGQLNAGTTALDHLSKIARDTYRLHGWDTPFTPLSHGLNYLSSFGTEKASLMASIEDAAQHYGQEVAKFYGGASSGERERERFMEALSAVKSPRELAAVLETEASLIPGKMDSLRGKVMDLGPMDRAVREQFERQERAHGAVGDYVHAMRTGKPIDPRVDAWVAQLTPGGTGAGSPAPAPGASAGAPAAPPGAGVTPAVPAAPMVRPVPAGPVGSAAPVPPSGVLPVGAGPGPQPGPGVQPPPVQTGPTGVPGAIPTAIPLQPVPSPGVQAPAGPAAGPGGAPSPIPEGAIAVNKATGQRIVRAGGKWVPMP